MAPGLAGFAEPGFGGPVDFAQGPAVVLGALAVVAAAMVLFLVIFPIVAIALEIVLLLILLLAAIVGRVVLRRPWTVQAVSAGDRPQILSWSVVGWRASRRQIDAIATALEAGTAVPPPERVEGPGPEPLVASGS